MVRELMTSRTPSWFILSRPIFPGFGYYLDPHHTSPGTQGLVIHGGDCANVVPVRKTYKYIQEQKANNITGRGARVPQSFIAQTVAVMHGPGNVGQGVGGPRGLTFRYLGTKVGKPLVCAQGGGPFWRDKRLEH